jgi:HAD superfamily hydrolase (TIGR01549 family)
VSALGSHIRAVVFDFDGTLFHLPIDFAAFRREMGLTEEDKVGTALQDWTDAGDDERLAVVTRYERESVPAGRFTPGAQEALRALRTTHRVAVLTRNSRHSVTDALGDLADGLHIVGREDVKRLKPDPEGLFTALGLLDARPAESAMVGDTFHDVEAAKSAGLRSIVLRNPKLAYAPEGADVYIETLTELVEATSTGAETS